MIEQVRRRYRKLHDIVIMLGTVFIGAWTPTQKKGVSVCPGQADLSCIRKSNSLDHERRPFAAGKARQKV
jgi:hypothetical protein